MQILDAGKLMPEFFIPGSRPASKTHTALNKRRSGRDFRPLSRVRGRLGIRVAFYAAVAGGTLRVRHTERRWCGHSADIGALGDFHHRFGAPLYERLVKELASLAFVAEATNVLLLGPPGVGKTHLDIALALKPIDHGYGTYTDVSIEFSAHLSLAPGSGRAA